MREFSMLVENTNSDFILLIKDQLKKENGIGFVQKIILLMLEVLRRTTTVEEADLIFNNFENIQCVLSEAFFRDEVKVTPFLKEFIYDYDRIDDDYYREYQYQRIKSGASLNMADIADIKE